MARTHSAKTVAPTPLRREFEAVYENNVLRPLAPVPDLPEHIRLRVTVDLPEREPSPADREARIAELERLADELNDMMTDEDWEAILEPRRQQRRCLDRLNPNS